MWFFISDNFDLKIETLILLDRISVSSFDESELEVFIKKVESEMLTQMNQSTLVDETVNETINLAESMRIDDDDLYKTFKPDSTGALKEANRMRRKTEPNNLMMRQNTWENKESFNQLDRAGKKQWLLNKIMELNISSNVQNQLVERIEEMIRQENQQKQKLKEQLKGLEDKIKRLKQNKSQNQLDEGKILEELELKEKQLIQLESEHKATAEKLRRVENEKGKMEEKFVSEVLGLQTGLDQKLLQIEGLDQRNRELAQEKEDLEDMVEDYKKFSDACKQKTREVEDEKNSQLKELRNEINWLKTSKEKEREKWLEKVEVEKLALEQTIKELMFKNKVRVNRPCKTTSTTCAINSSGSRTRAKFRKSGCRL